ncbi:MAG: hypothetical protein LJE59_00460 [Chromatiaceae bacterium]|nr:hypothetical protein [Chromatiaceae bacterium]
MTTKRFTSSVLIFLSALAGDLSAGCSAEKAAEIAARKTSTIADGTPEPRRFVARGSSIIDLHEKRKVFFKGIGYSPYLPGEAPVRGGSPGDDGRYREHFDLLGKLGINYLHVFPQRMPPGFFAVMDKTDLVYGQDIWLQDNPQDFLDPHYQQKALARVKAAIDHAYRVGRPGRLVLFSVGDEWKPKSIARTDALHPTESSFEGKHIRVSNRTPSETALARLIDEAMDYELVSYGQRHLYCHTSFTHVGPLADRYDLEVPFLSALTPDIGDLICLNVYVYARGVVSSPPGLTTGSPLQGYLEQLAAQSRKPIFVTQSGLSTSPISSKPWVPRFGGNRVEDVPDVLRAIWRDLRTAKYREKFCGLSFFEFQDEWWKSGGQPADAETHAPADLEEWFGIYAIVERNRLEPKGRIPATVREIFAEPWTVCPRPTADGVTRR